MRLKVRPEIGKERVIAKRIEVSDSGARLGEAEIVPLAVKEADADVQALPPRHVGRVANPPILPLIHWLVLTFKSYFLSCLLFRASTLRIPTPNSTPPFTFSL